MRIGAWLPSTEYGVDAERVVRLAQELEQAGISFLESSDHVLTTHLPDSHGSARMISRGYHDPFMLFSFLAPLAMTVVDDPDSWLQSADQWQTLGATHLALTYEGGGFSDLDAVTHSVHQLTQRLGEMLLP